MVFILREVSLKIIDHLPLHTLTTTVVILSLLLFLRRQIILNFLYIYMGRPDHFLANIWFRCLYKPNAAVPLVELELNDKIPEILARGSELVSL